MTTAEVDSIFQTHADYMANIRTISMAPTIQNVDFHSKLLEVLFCHFVIDPPSWSGAEAQTEAEHKHVDRVDA